MEIVDFRPEHSTDFKALNIAWLEKYFYEEAYDEEVLSNPYPYILDKGGHIFMVEENGEVMGTVSLMKMEKGVFKLTKMAISPNYQGRGIGQKLMEYCIAFAKAQPYKKLILYSNTILENAIYIYKKYGFVEIPLEADNHYDRSYIKMEHNLKNTL